MSAPYDPEHITYFAETDFRNQRTRFGIKSRDRTRHMYVIGKSGVGKSTLLENMAIQDIQHGEGVAVLDPHGSFAEKMLEYIPEHRVKDVVYFAPFDTDHPISFNVLEDVGHDKRHLVASGLMSSFKKIWVDAWSARMEYILNNILLALLEYPDATLLGVNRMLSDKTFRNKVVANITDPSVKSFWTDEFAKYGERYMQEAGAAIQNKIGQFTANPLVRNIIGQSKSSFDIRKVMDEQKILIINLSKGRIGEQNTSLLGSMIITKIYLGAMSRAEITSERMGALPNFYFYVDEFQSFANETFADILAEARKYKLALIIAHQYVAQMEEKVRDAVFGNVGTTVSFRVGPLDAELLEKVFTPQFLQADLINLGMAQIYLSLMINDIGSPPFSARTLPPLPRPTITFRNQVIEASRAAYSAAKEIVEKETRDWYAEDAQGTEERPPKKTDYKPAYRPPSNPSYQNPSSSSSYQGSQNSENSPRFQSKPAEHQPFKSALASAPKPFVREQTREFRNPAVPTQKPLAHVFSKAPAPVTQPEIEEQPEESKSTEITKTTERITITIPDNHHAAPPLSSGLSALLESLDAPSGEPALKPTIEEKIAPETPFVGEKSLRQNIGPVKHAERGPTQKNRDILKMALANAMKEKENKATAVRPPAPPVPKPVPQATAADTSEKPSEIPHDTLRKVLE